jgi:hypothetical protein
VGKMSDEFIVLMEYSGIWRIFNPGHGYIYWNGLDEIEEHFGPDIRSRTDIRIIPFERIVKESDRFMDWI